MADGQEDRESRVAALLEHCVRTELQVIAGSEGLELSDTDLENLMLGATVGVLRGFSVDWSPGWVRAGDVHAWCESDGWRARCGVCLLDSPPAETREQAARWAHAHEDSH